MRAWILIVAMTAWPAQPTGGRTLPSLPAPLATAVADEALRRQFTPAGARDAYHVFRSPRGVEDLARELAALDPAPAPGAWTPQRPEWPDAFGDVAPFDRHRVARLYRGRRLTVARGALRLDGRLVAFSLLAPYPAPALDRLVEQGAMVVVVVPCGVPGAGC